MFLKFLNDERGNVQSTEYILMIVLLAIGGVVGLATLRDQVAQELADVGVAMESLDQSYIFAVPGPTYNSASVVFDRNDMTTWVDYIVSENIDTPIAAPIAGAGAGGMTFTVAAVASEKVIGVSDGDSNN